MSNKQLIGEAREFLNQLDDDGYYAELIERLADALEQAEEQNKHLMQEVCKLACESLERDRALAKLEAEIMAILGDKE